MFPLPLFYYFEFAALLCCILCIKSIYKDRGLRFFPIYLVFIIAAELTARYIRKEFHHPNVWIYNLSIPVEYLFYGFVFLNHYKRNASRYLARWFIPLFLLFCILNITLIQGLGKLNSNILLTGSFFMILLSAVALYEIYLEEDGPQPWTVPIFWIAIGILLFNAGEFTYNLMSNVLMNKGIDKAAKFFASINNKLILVLYTCLIIAFICQRNITISRRE